MELYETPSGILVKGREKERKKIPKIVAYLSLLCWVHALRWTNLDYLPLKMVELFYIEE